MKPIGLLVGFALLASPAKIVNFDTGTLGQPPKDWTIEATHSGASTSWQILKDLSAPTQPYVLANTSSHAAVAVFNAMTLGDGDVSVRIKPISGHGLQGGGVVWRYRDENNFYLARANVLDKTISLFKVQNGKRVMLGTVAREIPLNTWSILKISTRGNRIQVFVDHRRILQAWDSTFNTPGKVGLCTDADAVTYFDDFRVWVR